MKKIIIYGSKYGTTKQYAEELSKKTNIEVLSYSDIRDINKYDEIIYIGALYAGGVLGMYKTLNKIRDISNKKIILVTVGLSDPKDEKNINNIISGIRKQLSNNIFDKAKIFHLRGGIDYSKLSFTHRTMMNLLYKKVKNLPEDEKTEEIKALIKTYNQKVNFIDFSTLKDIIEEMNK